MSDKAKTIFISSTFDDLKEYRSKIWELLGDYNVNIRGMEKFGARKEAPLVICLSEVEQCDVFLAIIAFRLGSIDESTGKSYTQREYEKAYDLNKEILIYIADENDFRISPQFIDFDERRQKLIAFKSILKERHTFDTFVSEKDLSEKVKRRLDELLSLKYEEKAADKDDYSQSKELVDRFLLLPKVYSGQEAKLQINFVGDPFPASKFLCSSFNFSYGETLGITIKINKPDIPEDSISHLFITKDSFAEYLAVNKQSDVEIYGILQFSENVVDSVRANFVRQVYQTGGYFTTASAVAVAPNWWGFQQPETHVVEAEGTIVVKLTKIINQIGK